MPRGFGIPDNLTGPIVERLNQRTTCRFIDRQRFGLTVVAAPAK